MMADQLHPRELTLPGDRRAYHVVCASFCTVILATDGSLWAMGVDETATNVHNTPLRVHVAFDYDSHPNKTDEELSVLPEYNEPYKCHSDDTFRKGYYAVAMIPTGRDKVFDIVIANGVARLQEILIEPRAPGKIVDISTGFRHTMIIVDDGEN